MYCIKVYIRYHLVIIGIPVGYIELLHTSALASIISHTASILTLFISKQTRYMYVIMIPPAPIIPTDNSYPYPLLLHSMSLAYSYHSATTPSSSSNGILPLMSDFRHPPDMFFVYCNSQAGFGWFKNISIAT